MQTASSQVDFDPYKMVSMNVLEELMRTIFDVSVSGVFIVDENYSVVVWNQWMEEHSSIERSRAIGRSVTAIFPQLSGSRIERSIQDAIERGNSSCCRMR